jgi:dipeptidyl aminopeptidase/acylaminoacyl peptidase
VDSAAFPTSPHLARILFLYDDLWLWRQETGTAVPLTSGGNITAYLKAPDDSAVAYIQDDNLWLWREDEAVTQLTENGRISDLLFSPDSTIIAYSRALGDDQYELWAINSDGGAARPLATASAAETWERNPDAEKIDLTFHWDTDSHILIYSFYATVLGQGDPAPEPTFFVAADSGAALTSLPPENREDVYFGYIVSFETQPDGRAELSLVNVSNGRVALTIPTRFHAIWSFSPDGRYLITSTEDGATLVDLANLSQRTLPLNLRSVGVGYGSAAPPGWWTNDTTWYTLIPDRDDVFQPGAMFTLWRVNAADGMATDINTFKGFVLDAELSPDGQQLAFWGEEGNVFGLRNLHLVDVANGQEEIYDNGRYSLLFDHWLSDSTHFVYTYLKGDNGSSCFLLGQLSQAPIPLPEMAHIYANQVQWLDETSFVIYEDFVYDEAGHSGTLYWQSLNGQRLLIGKFVAPASGQQPDASFIAYFVQP